MVVGGRRQSLTAKNLIFSLMMVGGRQQSLRVKNLNYLIDAGGWQTAQFESQKLDFFLLMVVGGRRQSLTAKT